MVVTGAGGGGEAEVELHGAFVSISAFSYPTPQPHPAAIYAMYWRGHSTIINIFASHGNPCFHLPLPPIHTNDWQYVCLSRVLAFLINEAWTSKDRKVKYQWLTAIFKNNLSITFALNSEIYLLAQKHCKRRLEKDKWDAGSLLDTLSVNLSFNWPLFSILYL